jgi:hypothetical protein
VSIDTTPWHLYSLQDYTREERDEWMTERIEAASLCSTLLIPMRRTVTAYGRRWRGRWVKGRRAADRLAVWP